MLKNLIIVALLVLSGWLLYTMNITGKPNVAPSPDPQKETEKCAQVITPARDPKTGTIREFPTPCAVPQGWELIQNDVPSLDELQ